MKKGARFYLRALFGLESPPPVRSRGCVRRDMFRGARSLPTVVRFGDLQALRTLRGASSWSPEWLVLDS